MLRRPASKREIFLVSPRQVLPQLANVGRLATSAAVKLPSTPGWQPQFQPMAFHATTSPFATTFAIYPLLITSMSNNISDGQCRFVSYLEEALCCPAQRHDISRIRLLPALWCNRRSIVSAADWLCLLVSLRQELPFDHRTLQDSIHQIPIH